MSYLATARAAWAQRPWNDNDAHKDIAATMERIGRACPHTEPSALNDQKIADLEEAVNLACHHRDRPALQRALDLLEDRCLDAYGWRRR
jgi:hypothetical protein